MTERETDKVRVKQLIRSGDKALIKSAFSEYFKKWAPVPKVSLASTFNGETPVFNLGK